jgi:hypothetical protein
LPGIRWAAGEGEPLATERGTALRAFVCANVASDVVSTKKQNQATFHVLPAAICAAVSVRNMIFGDVI